MNAVVPPPLHTSEPGSFAHETLRVRIPAILAKTRGQLPARPTEVDGALDELDAELKSGALRPLAEETADRRFWDRAVAPYAGHSWLDLPWFFAEAYFYRRLLEATGYFGQGPLAGYDPFAAAKAAEWASGEAPRRLADTLEAAPTDDHERLQALLHASLWGNRADLSYDVARQLGAFTGDAATDILVDESPAVIERLFARPHERVVIIADNAGTELLMDLALVDHLLVACGVGQIALHLKAHPTFVSDAVPRDLEEGLRSLRRSERDATIRLEERLVRHRDEGRLFAVTHPFYTTSLFYRELPPDLRAQLATGDLVVLKGDANYRRLCSDARWAPETPFAEVVADFPAPLVALRTLKAEVLVGLPPGRAEREAALDSRWLVNGRRAVIQTRL